MERVNLREHVVWSHPRATWAAPTEEQKDDETFIDHVQMMASDYLKMALAKVAKINPPEPYKLETFTKKILVIGGGITGISAALDAAKAGYEVTIVEKEASLGGNAAKWRKQLPTDYPYEKPMAPVIQSKIKELGNYPGIQVKTGTVVARIAGQPGDFTVTFKKPGEKIEFDVPFPLPPEMRVDESGKELEAEKLHARYLEYNQGKVDILTFDPNGEKFGAVVLAAGWRPYQPAEGEYAHLGLGVTPDVVTNVQFEEIAALNRLSWNADVRFIPVRCLGSVNVIWIKDALSKGMDGVFLMGCKHGDDYQCHFVKGSELAEIRVKKIGEALSSLALEPERVAQFQVAIDEYDKIPQMLQEFVGTIEALGPNPFKGF